jgi:large subunit ribosomal protein L6
MKEDIEKIMEIPAEMNVKLEGNLLTISAKGKEAKKTFALKGVDMKLEGKKIRIWADKATKRELKLIETAGAHINNMVNGLNEDYVNKLEICNVHFPMTVKVEGEKLIIKTFLGESTPRMAKLLPNVKVEVKGNEIIVSSHDREAAGQTAANIEEATRIRKRDRRVFQDGIFLVERCGRRI